MVFVKSYLPCLPFTETIVAKFVKRYQLSVLCNNRLSGVTVSRDNRSTWVIGFVDFGKKIESARFGTVWY